MSSNSYLDHYEGDDNQNVLPTASYEEENYDNNLEHQRHEQRTGQPGQQKYILAFTISPAHFKYISNLIYIVVVFFIIIFCAVYIDVLPDGKCVYSRRRFYGKLSKFNCTRQAIPINSEIPMNHNSVSYYLMSVDSYIESVVALFLNAFKKRRNHFALQTVLLATASRTTVKFALRRSLRKVKKVLDFKEEINYNCFIN